MLSKDLVFFKGKSSSDNGIKEVLISFDGGITYEKTKGAENWTYELNTKIYDDGIYPIWVVPVDKLGTKGFYSSLVIIDNKSPDINLMMPDVAKVQIKKMIISGFSIDDGQVDKINYKLNSLSSGSVVKSGKLSILVDDFFKEDIDISNIADGEYVLRVIATDKAGNTRVEKKIILVRNNQRKTAPQIIYPEEGSSLSGYFTIEGSVGYSANEKTVVAYIGNKKIGSGEINSRGFYKIEVEPTDSLDGFQELKVSLGNKSDGYISSPRKIQYIHKGAWVVVEDFTVYDYVNENFYLKGRAGFFLGNEEPTPKKDVEKEDLESEDAEAEIVISAEDKLLEKQRKIRKSKVRVQKVEVSLDNGQTFKKAMGKSNWRFKIRTPLMADGRINFLVKVTLKNGETTFVKEMLYLDQTPPEIDMSLVEGRKINGKLEINGHASDKNGIDSVEFALRKGPKTNYDVPDALKGLYVAVTGFGATMYNVGVGLSMLDDNLRLQIQCGDAPKVINNLDGTTSDARFYGIELGAKFLARLFKVDFGKYLGSDADFLSIAAYVGTGVSYFSMTDELLDSWTYIEIDENGNDKTKLVGTFLGSLLAQFEIQFDTDKIPIFSNYSIFGEFSLWFISSDIKSEVIPTGSIGVRLGIF